MDFENDFFDDKTPKAPASFENTPAATAISNDSLDLEMISKASSIETPKEENLSVELHPVKAESEAPKNPYEEWQKAFNERIERLKAKELEDIENRTKVAAAELEQWHKDRKKQIEDNLTKLLAQEPEQKPADRNDFDWVTAAKHLESSEFFAKDQSNGLNQKLIELLLKKRQLLEKPAEAKAKAEAK